MKLSMKRAQKPTIVAIGLLTVAGLAGWQFEPAWAGKALRLDSASTQGFIDKDLEQALSNHFQKRFYNLIDASEEQKAKLGELIARQLDEARPVRQKIKEGLIDLSDMMADESVKDEAITKKVEEIRTLREQVQDKRLNTALKARALLSKEQKQLLCHRVKAFLTANPRSGLKGVTE